jgi:predicted DsbA family dithiol-disulfide isomerase
MTIEIASDVMCPWCVIGYKNLSSALERLKDQLDADIQFQAFELNPDMPIEGQSTREHIAEKYGASAEQSRENQKRITEMGENAGFHFNFTDDSQMINTFDCHQLLTWAKQFDKQVELKMAMFVAHFTENRRLNNIDELLKVVESVGLD